MIEVIEWLSENALRSFPLVSTASKTANTSYVLPNGLILDSRIVYLTTPSNSYETLNSITNNGTTVTFTFSDGVSFTAATASTGYLYLLGTNNSMLTVNASYFSSIPVATHTFTNLYVEPSTIQEYDNSWLGVSSLTFSPNFQTTNDTGYYPYLYLTSQSSVNMVGNIEFFEGYNVQLNFDQTNSVIDIAVGNDYGLPLDCSTAFINSALCDCTKIVSYINGVPPTSDGSFSFTPGNNINLVLGTSVGNFYDSYNTGELANTHSLFVGLNFYQTDLCNPVNILPTT